MLSLISTLTKFLWVIPDGLLHRQQSLPPFLPDELIFQQSLPDDLIFEILLLLPVRSLLQFKCVCKSWKTLISNPQFVKAHLRSLTVNPTLTHQRLFSLHFYDKHITVSIPFKPLLESPSKPIKPVEFTMDHNNFLPVGSCNGLLCMMNLDIQLWLWNPPLRLQSKKSPTLNSYGKPFMSPTYYGFGYDHINDKYKVLVAFYKDVTRIYTFGANSWTTIQDFPCRVTNNAGKFVSGTLNWVIVETSVILSFDIVKETYKEVLLPEHDGVNVCNPVLGVSSNCLSVFFDSNKSYYSYNWDIWLMKKYGVVESWTRLMMIPREPLQNRLDCRPRHILFIFGNSNVLFRTRAGFVMYNLNNGSLDYLPSYISSAQEIYFESLVSPHL